MTTGTEAASRKVRDAVRRRTSPGRHVAPIAAGLFNLFMFLAVLAAFAAGAGWLWRTAMADPRFRIDGELLALAGAVRECPESVAELEAIGKRFVGRSLLDPRLVGDLRGAYEGSVWIKKVTRLSRNFPNRIQLELLLRMPAAQVWHDRRYWIIDADATMLPVAGSELAFPGLPEIVGVTAQVIGRRPLPGDDWMDEGVQGAMGILRAFWGSPLAETLPVSRVVVNTGTFKTDDNKEREIRRRFEVVSVSGAVVRWGTYNAGDLANELTSFEKLWHLQDLLRRNEALRPGVCFDVRTRLPGFSLIPD